MLILLATFASLRFGELAALTRRRVDLDNGLISITQAASELNDGTRSRRRAEDARPDAAPSRYRPCSSTTFDAHLELYAQTGPNGLVFVGPAGGPAAAKQLVEGSGGPTAARSASNTFTSTTCDTPETPSPPQPAPPPKS